MVRGDHRQACADVFRESAGSREEVPQIIVLL